MPRTLGPSFRTQSARSHRLDGGSAGAAVRGQAAARVEDREATRLRLPRFRGLSLITCPRLPCSQLPACRTLGTPSRWRCAGSTRRSGVRSWNSSHWCGNWKRPWPGTATIQTCRPLGPNLQESADAHATTELREEPGVQEAHPDATLALVADPEHIVTMPPVGCCGCGQALSVPPVGEVFGRRQVADLVMRRDAAVRLSAPVVAVLRPTPAAPAVELPIPSPETRIR